MDRPSLVRELGGKASESSEHDPFTIASRSGYDGGARSWYWQSAPPVHRDRSLIGILALGFLWFEDLRTGAAASITAIAEREKVSPRLVRRY